MEMFLVLLVFLSIAAVYFYIESARVAQQLKVRELKDKYEKALALLEQNPNDNECHKACLELGRIYYAHIKPDTADFYSDGRVSNFSDNTAGREALIKADMEARLAVVKYKP